MATPQYTSILNSLDYGEGLGDSGKICKITDQSILSGPNWLPNLTGDFEDTSKRWYCLDLLGKYHKGSLLKQFHALTFYFRNTRTNQKAIITSMLPESLTYSIGGVYGNPINLSGGDTVNAISQAFTGGNVSFQMAVNTSLIWQKPKTMEIVFRIPIFDDSNDGTNINYQEAIDLFGEAILPNVARNGTYESVPGPSVVTALNYKATSGKKQKLSSTMATTMNNGEEFSKQNLKGESTLWDRISVQVGGLLLLDWCVIKDLKVTFPNTKAMVLHDFRKTKNKNTNEIDSTNKSLKQGNNYRVHLQPLQAELEVTVATVMGVTRATFKDMLYQVESKKVGYDEEKEKGIITEAEAEEMRKNGASVV